MARISTYPNDTYVIGIDKWIGSDANNNNITKNFTADAVASYYNRVSIIDTGFFSWDVSRVQGRGVDFNLVIRSNETWIKKRN